MRLLPLLVVLALPLAAACDRPLVVNVNVQGAEKLALRGDIQVKGTLARAIRKDDVVVPKGAEVVVSETWLVRREGGSPPAYRINGLYDPGRRSEGFVLPSGALDVYYSAFVEPDRRLELLVPQEELLLPK